MKAILLKKYGAPNDLIFGEYPKPTPQKHEVLIKIAATAINDYDWGMVRGLPHMYRLLFGVFGPKHAIPGMELAGVVEAVGSDVTTLQPGDEVYGDTSRYGFGTFAEYLAINEKAVIKKTAAMNMVDAAAIPHAALLAYQSLQKANLFEGMTVLINGAGGGVGTLALQMLQKYNPIVTGVDSGAKLEGMTSLGFDHVLDYQTTDFTRTGYQYDFILDAKTTRPPKAYLRALKPGGVYVTVGGTLSRLLQHFLLKPFYSKKGYKELHILALEANRGLEEISGMYEKGIIKPLIDGPYSFEEIPRLIQYFGEGKHMGKIVIQMN